MKKEIKNMTKTENSTVNKINKAKKSIIKAVDQNNDGTLDMKDVFSVTGKASKKAKNLAEHVAASADSMAKEMERNQLMPLFKEDLESPEFSMTKLVRITKIDKKRAESEVCRGAIGYMSVSKEMRVVNIFTSSVQDFGLTFYPTADEGMYYPDPTDRNLYISLDRYFNDIKLKKMNELQKIAQDLGATHFRVSFVDKAASSSSTGAKADVKVNAKGKGKGGAKVDHSKSQTSKNAFSYNAENSFPGHAPVMPKLQYLKYDESIQSLIELRMDESSPTQHQLVNVQIGNSSGIKQKDAIKIDAAMKMLKVSGGATIIKEAKNEESQFFEFEVDFE